MRVVFSFALLLALAAHSASAKLSPLTRQPDAPGTDDSAMYLGPAGAMLEADYFKILPPRLGATRIFPCRFHLHATQDRSRLAQSCD